MLDVSNEYKKILDQIYLAEEISERSIELGREMFMVALEQSQSINYTEGKIRSYLNLSEYCLDKKDSLVYFQQAYESFYNNKINLNINDDNLDFFFALFNKFRHIENLPNEWLIDIIHYCKTIDFMNLSKTNRDLFVIQIDEILSIFSFDEETIKFLEILKENIIHINKTEFLYNYGNSFGETDFPVKRIHESRPIARKLIFDDDSDDDAFPNDEKFKSNAKLNFKDNINSSNTINNNPFKGIINSSSSVINSSNINNYPKFNFEDNVNSSNTTTDSFTKINSKDDNNSTDNKKNSESKISNNDSSNLSLSM